MGSLKPVYVTSRQIGWTGRWSHKSSIQTSGQKGRHYGNQAISQHLLSAQSHPPPSSISQSVIKIAHWPVVGPLLRPDNQETTVQSNLQHHSYHIISTKRGPSRLKCTLSEPNITPARRRFYISLSAMYTVGVSSVNQN